MKFISNDKLASLIVVVKLNMIVNLDVLFADLIIKGYDNQFKLLIELIS